MDIFHKKSGNFSEKLLDLVEKRSILYLPNETEDFRSRIYITTNEL